MKTNNSEDENLLINATPSRNWARLWLKKQRQADKIKPLISEEMEVARVDNCNPDLLTKWFNTINEEKITEG